jgi:hypothetical protein
MNSNTDKTKLHTRGTSVSIKDGLLIQVSNQQPFNCTLLFRYSVSITLSHVLVTRTGFGFVIGFINHLQVVITINYNTVPDFYTTKHSTLISSVYLHCSSQIYHTGTIQVSLNHTLPIKSSNHMSNLHRLPLAFFCAPSFNLVSCLCASAMTIIHS